MTRTRRAAIGVVLAAAIAGWSGGASAGPPFPGREKLSPEVRRALEASGPQEMVDVIVTLKEQPDLRGVSGPTRAARLEKLVRTLRDTADRTQRGLKVLLGSRRAQGLVAKAEYLWVFNGFAVTARADVIRELAARAEVLRIRPNATLDAPAPSAAAIGPEPNVGLVNAPALWSLGFRGQGVVVASMDTGVDVNHPDLAARWRGGTNSWLDPNGEHPSAPFDPSGHGTGTMGIMVGGSAGGTDVGVAPDARWIAVKIFNDRGKATFAAIHQGFQWLLDPDGNPSTPDAPHVVSNSWGLSSPGCNLEFRPDLQSLRAAGIVPLFSAGNAGPGVATGVSPANYPEAFAVGATTRNDVIYGSSSRGPSACGEPSTTFPELVAPGVYVRSTDLFATYRYWTGTSFAAPHAAAALALLLSAQPGLTVAQQEASLKAGAVDLGAVGPDSTYGHGRLDVLAAYNALAPPAPDFTLAASPASATVVQGESAGYTVAVGSLGGFAGDVSLSVAGLPAGATASFVPAIVPGGSGSSQITVATSASTPTGTSTLTVTGASGSLSRTASVTLEVSGAGAVTAFPASAKILTGSLRGGAAANLSADDSLFYEVNSTTAGTRTTSWYGGFDPVPNSIASLRITYKGKNSVTCQQTVEIKRFTDGAFVPLDVRDVGTAEVTIADLAPPGTPGDYVSGTSGNGELRVRVRCATSSSAFFSSANLMKIVVAP